jgi:hypothetical protein
MRKTFSWPERQAQTELQFKERHGSMLKLLADNAFRSEPETLAIEPHGSIQVVDSERNERYARLHENLRI